MPQEKTSIVIVGAGPAGLVCAAELLEKAPGKEAVCLTILEKDPEHVGGIARTMTHNGFRFDIGAHRFFSKSPEINRWWHDRLPEDFVRVPRLTRIFYKGVFFDYPLKAFNALFGLGLWQSALCVLSYARRMLFPVRPEKSFQDWVTNQFGGKLFSIFFKTYTEKVWGMPCDQISADWAAQRIKGLSLFRAIWQALAPRRQSGAVKTLIDTFEYPRLGSGEMWEKTRDDILSAGGRLLMGETLAKITREGARVLSVTARNAAGEERTLPGDQFIVTCPLRETILAVDPPLPEPVLEAARRLAYRDFITVALMLRRTDIFPDNWLYVHDPAVRLGRIQNFNNWNADITPGAGVTCLGLDYFCFEGGELWKSPDADLIALGKREIARLGFARESDVFDGVVVRQPKAYPVYGPGYRQDVETLRQALGQLENLQAVGRNGMHKYNNMDHSMMAALLAARRLTGSALDPWNVNTDAEYHEGGDAAENSGDA